MAGASDESISNHALWSAKDVSLIVRIVADDVLIKGGRTRLQGVQSLQAEVVQGRSANDAPTESRIVSMLSATRFVYVPPSIMTLSRPLHGPTVSGHLLAGPQGGD